MGLSSLVKVSEWLRSSVNWMRSLSCTTPLALTAARLVASRGRTPEGTEVEKSLLGPALPDRRRPPASSRRKVATPEAWMVPWLPPVTESVFTSS